MKQDLAGWLSYIESLHPKSIAMGLDRVNRIIDYLQLRPTFPIITVAGTNGKGSTCAMLEQIYRNAGYRVACYTSPHLLRYNERVRINGAEVSDTDLCAAFSVVETARLEADTLPVALTYFEVGTLAAMWHFMQADIDIAVLEIGLGGRLDAVNAFEPRCAIVTSIDLDHQEFLGNTRESVGFEKAGVYRPLMPAICGDAQAPASLTEYAKKIKADLKLIHKDFDYSLTNDGWDFLSATALAKPVYSLPLPAMLGHYQLANAACAVAAVESMQPSLPVAKNAIASAMQQVTVAGRFQTIIRTNAAQVILDVAHNPHAARALAENLQTARQKNAKTKPGRVVAVFAMLADKDIRAVVDAVKNEVDSWYVAAIDHARGALAADLADIINEVIVDARVNCCATIADAYHQASTDLKAANVIETCIETNENDKIVVFGSFFTVAQVMQILADK
jgi:dihydrofolate synthase/folylpolyglutamate synthase